MRTSSRVEALRIVNGISENLKSCIGVTLESERSDNTKPVLPFHSDLITEEEYASRKDGLKLKALSEESTLKTDLIVRDTTGEDYDQSIVLRLSLVKKGYSLSD